MVAYPRKYNRETKVNVLVEVEIIPFQRQTS